MYEVQSIRECLTCTGLNNCTNYVRHYFMNVVITGASRGLGKAVAAIFAANGHNLYLCSRTPAALYKAMEELVTKFPDVTIKAKPFDLEKKEEAIACGKWILDLRINVDILVNNAGIFEPGAVHSEADGSLERQMNTNLYSAYYLTRSLLPAMMARKSGHIFNMCSVASLQAYPNGGAYSISKTALYSFSKNLREEMKPHGIKVTAVIPGAAYTDSWAASGIDKNRFMEAGDIAQMIFAASQLSVNACTEEILLRPQPGDI
jgi:short-subunit dehydrogenase